MKKHPILVFFLIAAGLFFLCVFVVAITLFSRSAEVFQREPLAIVKIEGPIFDSEKTLKELEDVKNNPHIKGVILRLDSPGGAVAASQEIYDKVLEVKKDKKVVVSMGTVAASGAYYIACAADRIVANPGTITGSIGVIIESFGVHELMGKISIESRVIKSGEFKDVGNPFRELTPSDRVYLQNLTDNMYNQFARTVTKSRNIAADQINRIAEGRIFTGEEAQKMGLVDEMGNIYHAISVAKQLTGLPEDAEVRWPREPGVIERLFGQENAHVTLESLLKKLGVIHVPLWIVDMHLRVQ